MILGWRGLCGSGVCTEWIIGRVGLCGAGKLMGLGSMGRGTQVGGVIGRCGVYAMEAYYTT